MARSENRLTTTTAAQPSRLAHEATLRSAGREPASPSPGPGFKPTQHSRATGRPAPLVEPEVGAVSRVLGMIDERRFVADALTPGTSPTSG